METSAFLGITNELRQATLKLADDFTLQAQSQKLRNMDQELTDSIQRLTKNENMVLVVGEVKGGKFVSKKWVGDVPDGGWYPMQNPDGSMRTDSRYAFIMRKHGHG